ncbi:hypothetical protein G9A89_007685 [Geosiphon pyriformis]|nr:hypothetical protein G9A89_007685 [Geosiphon pyriformis]
MGICVYVSNDRHRLLAFYLSEPILAEAAASLMRDEKVFRKLLDFLLNTLHTAYVEPGYCGELVAHLLLMIAWDYANRNREILLSYLEKLGYSREFVSWPIRLVDGLLAFTHFIPLTYIPNQTQLRTFFIRFAAVICKCDQAGVDLILPVLLDWDGSSSISVDSMSYFLVQIKNWNQFFDDDSSASVTSRLSEKYVFKDRIIGKILNPYLSLYLQLSAPNSELQSLHFYSLPSFNTKPIKRAQLETCGKQYYLYALGLDKSVYHCLYKWSNDDIGVLKWLLCAWPDLVNLVTHLTSELQLRSIMPLDALNSCARQEIPRILELQESESTETKLIEKN